jgi:trehalose 6-phosphate phosphatase
MMPPELDKTSALFLDLDGTLLDIAATPELVVVPPDLPELLADLHHLLEGALAVVTGRPLAVIDQLLAPFSGSAAGEHGVLLRYEDGTLEEMPAGLAVPEVWRASLAVATEWLPGVMLERKPHGCAMHYRLAPEHCNEVWRLVRALVADDHPGFRLIPAREAVEIGPRAVSKGHAVERLMAQAPFAGRKPIFVGDDFTDEAGMTAARAYGGQGLRVAEVFNGEAGEVRAWLKREADLLGSRRAAGVPATGASS